MKCAIEPCPEPATQTWIRDKVCASCNIILGALYAYTITPAIFVNKETRHWQVVQAAYEKNYETVQGTWRLGGNAAALTAAAQIPTNDLPL